MEILFAMYLAFQMSLWYTVISFFIMVTDDAQNSGKEYANKQYKVPFRSSQEWTNEGDIGTPWKCFAFFISQLDQTSLSQLEGIFAPLEGQEREIQANKNMETGRQRSSCICTLDVVFSLCSPWQNDLEVQATLERGSLPCLTFQNLPVFEVAHQMPSLLSHC